MASAFVSTHRLLSVAHQAHEVVFLSFATSGGKTLRVERCPHLVLDGDIDHAYDFGQDTKW
jgi:hypothetical protein